MSFRFTKPSKVTKSGFITGQPLWYRQTGYGGYGYQRDVPAIFLRDGPKRPTIIVVLKDGTEKRISVLAENLRPRA